MEAKQELLGDLPIINHYIEQTGVAAMLDEHFPVHGNWKAPSLGRLVQGWLLCIISQCDHRLSSVEQWASMHLNGLRCLLNEPDLSASAFQDDRLGRVLEAFSDTDCWTKFEQAYTSNLLRVYDFEQRVVRVDSVNAPSYREAEPGSLFQFGYHKSHQAKEPFLKTMLATLDPLALPLAAYSVAGSECDDSLYIPVIEQVRKVVKPNGLLYVGDVKMGSLSVRAHLAGADNYYVCPLSNAAYPKALFEQAIQQALNHKDDWHVMRAPHGDPSTGTVTTQLYELPTGECQQAGSPLRWQERRVLVLSVAYAEAQQRRLQEKLQQAQTQLLERFIPRKHRSVWKGKDTVKANAFVDKTLDKYGVTPYLDVELRAPTDQANLTIHITPRQAQIDRQLQFLGWRVYVTNVPASDLSASQLVDCYRQEYRIEQQFHKLLTKTTALLPIFLKRENRVVALVRLLLLALQLMAILQHTVRTNLANSSDPLTDLIPGNKTRRVRQPTAELVLQRFKPILVLWVQLPEQPLWSMISNFEPVHAQILRLLRCPDNLYTDTIRAFKHVNELA